MAEIAQLAAWYHWPLGTLLDLEHADRERFLSCINEAPAEPGPDRKVVNYVGA